MPDPASVCVAWVHPHEVAYSWAMSMLEFQREALMSGQSGRFLAIRYGSGGIANARNRAAAKFLDECDEDWLFWIDTDMGFDPDIVDRLLESADPDERPVVGALCYASKEVQPDGMNGYETFPVPTVYRWAQQPDGSTGFTSWHEYPRDALYQCEGTGSAAILIHRSVFQRIRDELGDVWYTILTRPDADPFGEDLSFCVRLAQLGIPLHVDTSVKTTHLKHQWLGESNYEVMYAAAMAAGQRAMNPTGETKNGASLIGPKPNRGQRRAAAKA